MANERKIGKGGYNDKILLIGTKQFLLAQFYVSSGEEDKLRIKGFSKLNNSN